MGAALMWGRVQAALDVGTSHALDIIMDDLDDLALADRWPEVDALLDAANLDHLPVSCMLSVLAIIPKWAPSAARERFLARCDDWLTRHRPAERDELLRGLR